MKLKSLIKNIYLGIGYSCSNLFLRLSYSLYRRMSGQGKEQYLMHGERVLIALERLNR